MNWEGFGRKQLWPNFKIKQNVNQSHNTLVEAQGGEDV
jgi:hypothetical protein